MSVLETDEKKRQLQSESDEQAMVVSRNEEQPTEDKAVERNATGVRMAIDTEQGAERKERGIFSVEEANSLTSYVVESQKAFSVISVVDIQHGEHVSVESKLLLVEETVAHSWAEFLGTCHMHSGM